MSDRLTSDQAPFLLELGSYDEDVIQVVRFDSSERISAPFEVRVELASRDFHLDLESTVGKPAMMSVRGEYEERFIHGVVAEIESGVATANHCFYHAVIRPKLWLASQRSNCQIFQEMNVVDIAREVLGHHGLSDSVDFEFRLDNEPPPREYCVQYRESDLDFISRLMEEEGIFYWIEHGVERAKVLFGDGPGATPNIHGDYDVRMAAPSGLVAEEFDEQVFEFRSTKRVRPGGFASTDYSFKEPSSNLATTADAGVDQALEVFDFPGEYTDSGVGSNLAKVRMEEQQVARREVSGRSNCTRFHPGMTFDLIEHPRDVLNASYLLTELRQLGASPQVLEEGLSASEEARYSNEFVGIPADQRFRPARVTPRPVVRGTQVAKVVGPVGDEIHCDQYGRVRVQFFWDRYAAGDQTSSCWIRVSQAWADG
ncbi:MAG: type VI secretion system tip protein TssI/VgrG, partial [Planctomycetota bacterium]